jgi:hypothetical protein
MEKGSALEGSSGGGGRSGVNGIAIAAVVIAVLVAALILLSVLKRNRSSSSSHYLMDESGHNRSFAPLVDDGRSKLLIVPSFNIHGKALMLLSLLQRST